MEQLDTTVLSPLIRPFAERLSNELLRALADLKADAETQARYDLLADGHTEGTLTPEETAELGGWVRTFTFFSLMKVEAQALLKEKGK